MTVLVLVTATDAADAADAADAVLCCLVLSCAVLCCLVLFCAVLCCLVLSCAVLCCFVLSCAVLCCFVLFCAVLCCFVLCFRSACVLSFLIHCAFSSSPHFFLTLFPSQVLLHAGIRLCGPSLDRRGTRGNNRPRIPAASGGCQRRHWGRAGIA